MEGIANTYSVAGDPLFRESQCSDVMLLRILLPIAILFHHGSFLPVATLCWNWLPT